MKLHLSFFLLLLPGLLSAQIKLVSAQRIEVNATYDTLINPTMQRVMAAYQSKLNQEVSRTIGESSLFMASGVPESLLSNFLSDQLLDKARSLSAQPIDLAIINMGGIRAPLRKGPITVGDIYNVMPFENQLVILTLKGIDLMSIFQNIAQGGGEGIAGATLEIKDKSIHKLLIGGALLDEAKVYRVATMDYLAEGNSGMTAFLHALEKTDTGLKIRDCYLQQIEKLTANGVPVEARLDGRIKLLTE